MGGRKSRSSTKRRPARQAATSSQGAAEGTMPDSSVPRLGSVADLIKYGARNTDRGHDIFERWELPDDDLIAQNAAKRLARLWRRWSYKQKEELLLAVEGIVSAELAKQAWNPGVRKRHQGLSQSAVAAARLAENIGTLFPPPWQGENQEIGRLVHKLFEFSRAGLDATARPARYRLTNSAKLLVGRTRPKAPWELLRDLVWLVSKNRCRPSERTVRRYLTEPLPKLPVDAYWLRNWSLMNRVAQLTGTELPTDAEHFERAARYYVDGPS